jgi:hypothetical protein
LVQIERPGVGVSTGTAQSGCEESDVLRAVARAAADAVSEAYETEAVVVRVRGVQPVEAFAQTVLIVSLVASRGSNSQVLLGVCDGTGDVPRGVALAVLNGANRFLGAE